MAAGNLQFFTFADPENGGEDSRWQVAVFAKDGKQATSLAIAEVASQMSDDNDNPIPPEVAGDIIAAIVSGEAEWDNNLDPTTPSAVLLIRKPN